MGVLSLTRATRAERSAGARAVHRHALHSVPAVSPHQSAQLMRCLLARRSFSTAAHTRIHCRGSWTHRRSGTRAGRSVQGLWRRSLDDSAGQGVELPRVRRELQGSGASWHGSGTTTTGSPAQTAIHDLPTIKGQSVGAVPRNESQAFRSVGRGSECGAPKSIRNSPTGASPSLTTLFINAIPST
jgi:hypothetical protein